MNQYHKVLCELLDRCAPHGYYFGLCNENIRGVYSGDTYGFWKEEEKEKADNLRTLVEKKILEYQEKSNNFSKFFIFMGTEGIEPPAGGLEPPILPLNYAPVVLQEIIDF